MKRLIDKIMLIVALTAVMCSCSDSDTLWNEMPRPVMEFVSAYFPGRGVSSVAEDGNRCFVKITNGPSLVFDSYKWRSITGNGETLPQVLLFDELPPAVYSYLQDNGEVGQVESMSRTDKEYRVTTQNGSSILYDIATNALTSGERTLP